MSKLLENIGLAVRDGVYETFMMYTNTTDLQELKESGYTVKEFPLGTNKIDRLYVLQLGNTIHLSCSLEQITTDDVEVKMFTPLETSGILKSISKSKQAARQESNRAAHIKRKSIRRVK